MEDDSKGNHKKRQDLFRQNILGITSPVVKLSNDFGRVPGQGTGNGSNIHFIYSQESHELPE